ncbi:hypothetical protein [Chelativorans salis]|uniref:Uncharacterized protein n=1 Tax=Chelativorans salis TaxID=2978478 RepID=A0ABT2LTU6_9HYPH|nr:hypothetical protein [Chelativorans sp. EGI FJ00035]MCT7377945.1 hypothetical protein [Chelativorans sp. EGI FJ00035]
MIVERAFEPHAGVYTPEELGLLRGVVREALRRCGHELDQDQVEAVARIVVDAYSDGVSDSDQLLDIATAAAIACLTNPAA